MVTANDRTRSMLLKLLLCFLGVLASSSAAWAGNDVVEVKIKEVSPPGIIALTEGGSDLSQNTYSSSASIKVQYQLVASTWPAGTTTFGTFKLGVRIVDHSADSGTDTSYPLDLTIGQNGADQNLQLTSLPTGFTSIAGPGDLNDIDTTPVVVTMKIHCGAPAPDCTDNSDGASFSANLQFSGTAGKHLDTSVKIQVTVTLVHPDACTHLYNFLTDQTLTNPVTSTSVGVVKNGPNAGKVTSTSPFGQFSDNLMLVNLCGANSFDLKITLDPSFITNPNNNPGNAVFTFISGEVVDPESFDISSFGLGTKQGQTLCLSNIQLDLDQTLLATVHMEIQLGINKNDLSPSPFTFEAQVFQPNSSCGGGTELDSATAEMTYTIKQ